MCMGKVIKWVGATMIHPELRADLGIVPGIGR